MLRLLVFVFLFLVTGCATEQTIESNIRPATVEEYYATDRDFIGDIEHGKLYGNNRATMTYGYMKLSRPQYHVMGCLQKDGLAGDSLKCFVLRQHKLWKTEREFLTELFGKEKRGAAKDILLYVHGFNTTFEKAAVTMAQVVSDLDFRGNAIFFSWPSNGKMLGYVGDQNNTEWSSKNLKAFLKDIAQKASPKSICIIAHSMGNRETVSAFAGLMADAPELRDRFRLIIMAAPDVDSTIFERDFAPVLTRSGALVTLYVSRNDRAMRVSKNVNGYVRLGGVDEYPLVLPGIDTVDVTNVDNDYPGHDYFATSRLVLSDIYYMINHKLAAKDRFSLSPARYTKDGETRTYWIFKK
ncbi:MAG TPA: alpha/beta hydrolase [Chlorobaculum sp.]|nr:alpha/beta hydrolase [Chlorobaculum sp.]